MTDDERGRVASLVWRVAAAIRDAYWRAPQGPIETPEQWEAMSNAAIKAMREGERKPFPYMMPGDPMPKLLEPEGEARAAGEALLVTMLTEQIGSVQKARDPWKMNCEAAESKLAEMRDPPPKRVYDCLREEIAERTAEAETLRRRSEALDVALQAAESLAKAEREQRESEGVAYRNEIAELRRVGGNRDHAWKEVHAINKQVVAERDEANRIAAHWKHLACDPQTRENINVEKVAECERLRALLASVRAHVRGHEMNGSEEASRAVDEIDRALGAWKTP